MFQRQASKDRLRKTWTSCRKSRKRKSWPSNKINQNYFLQKHLKLNKIYVLDKNEVMLLKEKFLAMRFLKAASTKLYFDMAAMLSMDFLFDYVAMLGAMIVQYLAVIFLVDIKENMKGPKEKVPLRPLRGQEVCDRRDGL